MSDTLAENKALAMRWLDLVSAGDLDGLCRLIAPTWRLYGGPPGKVLVGHDGLRELFAVHLGPIEQKWTVEDVIAEGDRVVVRATNTCVQDEFAGIPARGKRQVFTATFTFRIADGRIAETWRNADDLGRLLQLGARIEPGEPL
jgi:ketosteroid isomerase-like protein